MATMVHKAGTALQTGATASPVEHTHTQSDSRNAAGELVILYDKDGIDLSAYVTDPHKEMSFEAVLEASVEDKEIGDVVTVGQAKYLVTEWRVTESNQDVKRVSIGLRSTSLSAASPAPAGGGATQTN